MKQATRHHSHLFLLEITLAILFFSLASAVCLRCFAKSHILSQQATELNQAVSQTENVAELLRSLPENKRTDVSRITERLQEEYPMIEQVAAGQWILYFDDDWNSCEKSQAVYQMQIVGTDVATDSAGDTSIKATGNSGSVDPGNAGLSMIVFQLTVFNLSTTDESTKSSDTAAATVQTETTTETTDPAEPTSGGNTNVSVDRTTTSENGSNTSDNDINIYQLELKLYAKES